MEGLQSKKFRSSPATNALVHPISHFRAISGRNNAKGNFMAPTTAKMAQKKPPARPLPSTASVSMASTTLPFERWWRTSQILGRFDAHLAVRLHELLLTPLVKLLSLTIHFGSLPPPPPPRQRAPQACRAARSAGSSRGKGAGSHPSRVLQLKNV